MWLSTNMALVSYSGFSPTIIKSFGYTAARAQLFTVPPSACAAFLSLFDAFLSDGLRSRGIPIVCFALLCSIGWIILIAETSNNKVRYFALHLAVIGSTCQGCLTISWVANTAGSSAAAAVRIGFMSAFGQTFSSEL